MAGKLSDLVASVRTALWHLRKGGPAQLRRHLHNKRLPGAGRPKRLFELRDGGRTFQPWVWPESDPRSPVRVGLIADAFTTVAFQYEWHQVPLTPEGWRAQLDTERLDLLFVESAWQGNQRAWQYHLTGPSAPRPAIVELVAECRRRGIPTVFWNKEDPTHFEDFLATAGLFDWVFTTDSECLPRYREALGHDQVAVLPFAVPDRVCNPIRVTREHQPLGIAFAGTWFTHKFPERRDQMRLLFDAAIAAETPDNKFDIYSRLLGDDDRYQFPQPYAAHITGSLSYDEMLSAYRSYKVFLNVNTVTTSPTMCARRVLELVACGTPVVSTPAPSLEGFVGDAAVQVSAPDAATDAIRTLLDDPLERARRVHAGQRLLWQQHTYSHRVHTVLDRLGLPTSAPALPPVSILMSTKRPHQLDHVLEYVARQRDVDLELLIATHDFEAPADLIPRAHDLGIDRVTVVPMPADAFLGDCLNALAGRAEGEVLAKMDDDDWYGADYLADLLRAMRFADADIVGKHARFVHLAAHDVTVLTQEANEHRYTHFVAGPTLTARRAVFEQFRFPSANRGEDSSVLERATEAGLRIYAADRFNFVQMRTGNPADHTWTVEDESFLAAPRHFAGHAVAQARV